MRSTGSSSRLRGPQQKRRRRGSKATVLGDWALATSQCPNRPESPPNGTYFDDEASDDQTRELAAIFQGQRGGTMEILGGLISTWLPVEKTSIRASKDGDIITATIGSVGKVSSKAIRDDEGHGFTLRGGGFVGAFGMEEAELAPSNGTKWSDPDMTREFETKSGARGIVTMSG